MLQNWKTYILEDVLDALIDYRGKTPKKKTFGIPLVTAKIVKQGRIQEANEFIAEADYNAWMTRGMPKVGDVVLTTEAPLGEVAQIINSNIALAQRIVTLRGKQGILDNGYLKYFLLSSKGQSRLEQRQSGTTVFGIKQSELRKVEIDCPSFEEQRDIASILSALDDKIELNLQMNKTLEEMAMALYKHWFVDFGPFRDGGFVTSELGEIPKGWEVKRLADIYTNHNRKRAPISTEERAKIQGVYPYYGATKILDYINDYKFDGEYILLAEDGTVKTERDTPYLQYVEGQFWVSNHAHVLTGNNIYSTEFLYLSLANVNVLPIITGAVQLKINKENLESLKFITAPENILRSVDGLVIPIFKQIKALGKENQTLTALRDTLLPKLISGEVRVKDASKLLAEVL